MFLRDVAIDLTFMLYFNQSFMKLASFEPEKKKKRKNCRNMK